MKSGEKESEWDVDAASNADLKHAPQSHLKIHSSKHIRADMTAKVQSQTERKKHDAGWICLQQNIENALQLCQ